MQLTRILYTTADRTARITLNRPEKRNALDDVMIQELTSAIVAAGKDQGVKVVVLSGNGPAFCAGADIAYLRRVAEYDLEQNRIDSERLANLFRVIYELRKPIIAVVNGPALAGGCGLASACDFVIASGEHASFGYPEVRIGFIPAVVMLFLVKRVGEGRARELVLRGNTVSAKTACDIGLVSMVVPEGELNSACNQLLEDLLVRNSLTAMGLCKETFSKLHGLNLVESLEFGANMNAAARMTPDCRRGLTGFLKKEKTEW
ncbi:MAG: enoyl-CoA hydratase/isomerase family protein [Bacteroidetes bacterium]|nr:enoyl-CoA hydratase/isomerase family protein [Bacteroidota bacterium]